MRWEYDLENRFKFKYNIRMASVQPNVTMRKVNQKKHVRNFSHFLGFSLFYRPTKSNSFLIQFIRHAGQKTPTTPFAAYDSNVRRHIRCFCVCTRTMFVLNYNQWIFINHIVISNCSV